VGGKNKVPMPQLKTLFEQSGFSAVTTYINSGNVFFDSDMGDAEAVRAKCDALLRAAYNFEVPVMILTAEALADAIAHAPDWWNTAADEINDAFFVIPPLTPQEVSTQVGEARAPYERVAFHGQVIFWSAPRKTYSRTRWSKVVQCSAYRSLTIRNANTAVRLAQLAQDKR
jgi:uncharacterized protein (DUF1697 family)